MKGLHTSLLCNMLAAYYKIVLWAMDTYPISYENIKLNTKLYKHF